MENLIWQVLIGSILVAIILMGQRVINTIVKFGDGLDIRAEKVQRDALVIKNELIETTAMFARRLTEIHILVNNNMMVQLRLNAELSRWKADHSKNDPDCEEYIRAAEAAERALKEHIERQLEVDRLAAKPIT